MKCRTLSILSGGACAAEIQTLSADWRRPLLAIKALDRGLRSSRLRSRDRSITAANLRATSCPGPSIDARCSIKLSTPPKLVARIKIFVFAAAFIAASRPPLTSKESIPPNIDIWRLRGNLVSRMRPQSRIMHVLNLSMLRKKVCYFERVLGMCAHPPRQRAHAAQDQPAIERRGDCAAGVLDTANRLEKIVVVLCNDNSAEPRHNGRRSILWWNEESGRRRDRTAVAAPAPKYCRKRKLRRRRERSSATAARSTIFNSGFEGVSIQASFVFARRAFLTAARSLMSVKSTSKSPAQKNFSD